LGKCAAHTLLRTDLPISRLRGRFYIYQGIKVIPTFHPAYLLRNPQDKRLVWEDLQLLQKAYRANSTPKAQDHKVNEPLESEKPKG